MNIYHTVTAILEGKKEELYGSFIKLECAYEIDAEKESWKEQGYKNIKIESKETVETPDAVVYKDDLITSHELFLKHAPSFNFEKSEVALLHHALEAGFVTKVEGMEDTYLINRDYS